jgi:hypothetical protein
MLYAGRGYWTAHVNSRTKEAFRRAYRGWSKDDQAKNTAALQSASVLEALVEHCQAPSEQPELSGSYICYHWWPGLA